MNFWLLFSIKACFDEDIIVLVDILQKYKPLHLI